jgi:hypothetical protein
MSATRSAQGRAASPRPGYQSVSVKAPVIVMLVAEW